MSFGDVARRDTLHARRFACPLQVRIHPAHEKISQLAVEAAVSSQWQAAGVGELFFQKEWRDDSIHRMKKPRIALSRAAGLKARAMRSTRRHSAESRAITGHRRV